MITVIVPFFNSEEYLNRCIESIIMQTFSDLEIVLVNDGSTDRSLEIANYYAKRDERIRIVSQENQGLIAARKTGLREAHGKWVAFVDSDDWIENGFYAYMDSIVCKKSCDMVSTGILYEYMGGEPSEVTDLYAEGYYSDLPTEIYPTMIYSFKKKTMGLRHNMVTKLFRRELLIDVYRNINSSVFYGEDALTVYSYILRCSNIYISHKCYYHYCTRFGSMCFSQDERLFSNAKILFESLKKTFSQDDHVRELLPQLERYIIDIYSHALKTQLGIDVVSYAKWNFGDMVTVCENNFILYGAGSCGKAFYRSVCDRGLEKNMVCWIDKNPDSDDKRPYGVVGVEALKSSECQMIVIALKAESMAQDVMAELHKDWGVPYEKMIWNKMDYSWLI